MFFALAGMLVVAAFGAFLGAQNGGGAGRFTAMIGLAIGATLLGFIGAFVMSGNSDSFGR